MLKKRPFNTETQGTQRGTEIFRFISIIICIFALNLKMYFKMLGLIVYRVVIGCILLLPFIFFVVLFFWGLADGFGGGEHDTKPVKNFFAHINDGGALN